jgi:hypothetical protein
MAIETQLPYRNRNLDDHPAVAKLSEPSPLLVTSPWEYSCLLIASGTVCRVTGHVTTCPDVPAARETTGCSPQQITGDCTLLQNVLVSNLGLANTMGLFLRLSHEWHKSDSSFLFTHVRYCKGDTRYVFRRYTNRIPDRVTSYLDRF